MCANSIQLPWISKIVDDETWLEGERRGCEVSRRDPEVQMRVAEIILSGLGQLMRERAEQAASNLNN